MEDQITSPSSARREKVSASVAAASPKLIDLIRQKEEKQEVFFSFEYFPPKTEQGVINLYNRFEVMAQWKPLFIDVTWGAGGRASDLTIDLCVNGKAFYGLEPNMHLTCTNMPVEKIDTALDECKANGIRNILALRGDPPRGEEWQAVSGGFSYATDLVKYIREKHGSFFSIAVAGYPEKHVDSASKEDDLKHLKEKVDAGADLIITQLFYRADIFLDFVKDCRAAGITVPILPGLMPIRNYDGLVRMCSLCGSSVPQSILDDMKDFKDDDKAVQAYGVKHMVSMCKELLQNGVYGLHFYTLNQERQVKSILVELGLIKEVPSKELPWTGARGRAEDVRPIFWANRPKTYISRTREWDEFPNGRWGDSGSPSFSTLDIYHLNLYRSAKETRLKEWGTPTSLADVANVFVSYLNGKVSTLPWNTTQVAPEAGVIFSQLKFLNSHGFFTINSQPRVNASPSDHPVHGWGPNGGYVWQKAYVEFFCSSDHLEKLKNLLSRYPSLQLQAISKSGNAYDTYNAVTAVTWGVFPGSELKQPTVVDPEVFRIWKDEAFALWTSEWSDVYSSESPSYKLIEDIANTFYLVHIIDNDFISGDIFAIFQEVIESEVSILCNIRDEKKLLEAKWEEVEEVKKQFEKEKEAWEAEKQAWKKEHTATQ